MRDVHPPYPPLGVRAPVMLAAECFGVDVFELGVSNQRQDRGVRFAQTL